VPPHRGRGRRRSFDPLNKGEGRKILYPITKGKRNNGSLRQQVPTLFPLLGKKEDRSNLVPLCRDRAKEKGPDRTRKKGKGEKKEEPRRFLKRHRQSSPSSSPRKGFPRRKNLLPAVGEREKGFFFLKEAKVPRVKETSREEKEREDCIEKKGTDASSHGVR